MARWFTDGSSGFTVDGNVVAYKDEKRADNVFNCLWEDGEGVSSGKHYWKIHFETLEGGAGVGLTSKDHFNQGYACKAIKYSGNLSNGSGVLVEEFGPLPRAGDVIGILASFEYNRLIVDIDVNGKSLGMAFNVPASIFKSVYPLVSFKNNGSATCRKETDGPTTASTTFTDIEGLWDLAYIEECENSFRFTLATTTLKKEEANKYSWSIRVSNYFSTSLWKEEGNWKTSAVSTYLYVGAESTDFERQLTELMEKVKVLKITPDGSLLIKSETISTVWTRYYDSSSGYIGNPF